MSQQVTCAELDALEYGQIDLQARSKRWVLQNCMFESCSSNPDDLQELLGDALTEVQHCKEVQCIDSKSTVLLRDQAHCAAAHADYVYTDLTQSSTQV